MIREAAVAGQFYPGDAQVLGRTVDSLLGEVGIDDAGAPKALIVPHAGYMYSGPVAASAYARLQAHRDRYRRVILLGPCHRVPVRGLAFSGAKAFRTPLGDVPLDRKAIKRIDSLRAQVSDATHEFEHSLEVHLPFLQSVLGQFKLVPIVVGHTTQEAVAHILDALWGGAGTLIVISSDLSHYLGYDQARAIDDKTRQAIENLDARAIDHDAACGATPIGGLLIAAKRRGLKVVTLDMRNSGDTAGDRSRVVGYGSWMFIEP
jgi:AmmeMemoRadiSam system protein B